MKSILSFRGALLGGCVLAFLFAFQPTLHAQALPTTDVLGVHDLGSSASPLRGPNANACVYCHVPHSGLSGQTPMWNQTLSTKQYNLYPSSTSGGTAPTSVSTPSMLCLSCHDGSVAVGSTVGFGTLKMTGALTANLGTNLQGSHPFSMQPQLKDDASLAASLVSSHLTKDPAVKLINNNVECSSCHNVHNQYIDRKRPEFLVRDNTSGQLCFACHDTGARTVNGVDNSLVAWPGSIHAKSTAAVATKAGLGNYSGVSEFACGTCHTAHNGLTTALMHLNPNRPANVDDLSQACFTCHDGGTNLSQPLPNVLADFTGAGQKAHPFADSTNQHVTGEAIVEPNRHVTCADCHNAHAAQPTGTFAGLPGLRPSQAGVSGVAADGTLLKTANNQYENCLRCHGTSDKKGSLTTVNYGYFPDRALFAGDKLNVALQFAASKSSHPVMRTATNLARPSLLSKGMWNLTFTGQTRAIPSQILCTDCHNSDLNREFGGAGPNGPHGSKNDHILERPYLMSQIAPGGVPGDKIANIPASVVLDPIPTGTYALCAKCHDLKYIATGADWSQHDRHIGQVRASCSVCHSAHGVPGNTARVTGNGLVSFDMNVVGVSKKGPVAYNGGTNCTLKCHGHDH